VNEATIPFLFLSILFLLLFLSDVSRGEGFERGEDEER